MAGKYLRPRPDLATASRLYHIAHRMFLAWHTHSNSHPRIYFRHDHRYQCLSYRAWAAAIDSMLIRFWIWLAPDAWRTDDPR